MCIRTGILTLTTAARSGSVVAWVSESEEVNPEPLNSWLLIWTPFVRSVASVYSRLARSSRRVFFLSYIDRAISAQERDHATGRDLVHGAEQIGDDQGEV